MANKREQQDMYTGKYKVINSVALRDGTFALAGIVEGELPDVGSVGISSCRDARMSVEVLGIGVVDPHLVAPDRQGLLVKLISGDEKDLDGTTFEFVCNVAEETD